MKRLIILICVLALLGATAVSAAPLETDRPCSLTLHYARNGQGFPGLPIPIYRVADFAADGTFDPTEQFAGYPVNLYGITSQTQWQEAADTLIAYIAADGLTHETAAVTDEAGDVVFATLMPGLYLVPGVEAATQTESFLFQPFFVFLPTPNEDDSYSYDVQANPKPGQATAFAQYSVVKLWKDNGAASRPKSITVDILWNGQIQETVTLGPENDWAYTWYTDRTDGVWTVAERNVASGYNVTVTSRENVFTIVNTADTPKEDRPGTGDTAPLQLYVMTACISGLLLLVLGAGFKRKTA